jgi:ornithine carbamoyltransferase
MQHLVNLSDLGSQGLIKILDEADRQRDSRGRNSERPLLGKQVALVFEKASTRTRLSLEVAVVELGGHPIVITQAGSQMGRGEPIRDSARVLGRMVHAITFRTSERSRLDEMIQYAGVPVLNALTDESHPMQLCADLTVVRKHFGSLKGLEFAWVGDGNNMAQSWIEAIGLLQGTLRLAYPKGFEPNRRWIDEARARGGRIEEFTDPIEAVRGAHVISTDVFASMGQEAEADNRKQAFQAYQLDEALLKKARPDAVVLHCLPAHRGEEISDAVLEGNQSIVWDQAEARLHTAKALLLWALGHLKVA